MAEISNKDINNNNADDNFKENILFSYEEYNGTINNDKLKLINENKEIFKNLLLYINPDNILNNLNMGKEKFRDEQKYFDSNIKKSDNNRNIYYIVNSNLNISNYVHKSHTLVDFIINNHGLNYIILNIESIYNYLLIKNKNDITMNELEIM
jgi:hypothetical protein